MNEKMIRWKAIQSKFQELQGALFCSDDSYVRRVRLEASLEQGEHRFDWTCEIRTRTSVFELHLEWPDTRSAAFTCLSEGIYEPQIEHILCESLSSVPDSLFIDIGANEGFHSLNCLSAVPTARVVAFEPNPFVRARLEKNLDRNDFGSRSTVYPLGLSSDDGSATFFVPAFTGSGGGSLMNLHPEEGRPSEFTVQLITLDSLALSPSVIKIDVEGNEMNVLLGARETISRSRPVIVAELLRKWMAPFSSSPQEAAQFILSHGYEMFAVGVDYIKKIEEIDAETVETNFLFRPLSIGA